MSSFKRGVLDGVIHYCDGGWWTAPDKKSGGGALWPWCLLDIKRRSGLATLDIPRAEPPPRKREMVTCLLCMGLRQRR